MKFSGYTLGGGITIEKVFLFLPFFGLKHPFLIQKSEIFFSSSKMIIFLKFHFF